MKRRMTVSNLNARGVSAQGRGSSRRFASWLRPAAAGLSGFTGTRLRTLGAWLALVWILSPCARAADLRWTNSAGGSWNTAANWSPNQVPTSADRAWITNAGTYTVTVSGNAAVGELTLGGNSGTQTLSLSGGTFVPGTVTGNANAVLRITGGTLGGNGGLTLAGPLNWSGGTITNTVQCGGGAISGSATKTLRYGGLINTGLLVFSGGYLELYSGAAVSNLASGTFDITADCDISYYSSSSGPFYNAGVLRKSAGTGTSLLGAPLVNEGRLEAQSGMLRLTASSEHGGVATAVAPATLSLMGGTHDFAPGSTLGGSGTIECSGSAVLNLNSDVSLNILMVSGRRITGPGSVTASTLVWEQGTIETTIVCDGGTILVGATSLPKLRGGRLINRGLLTGGQLSAENGAVITNLATGTLDFTNATAGIRYDGGDQGLCYNAGLVRRREAASQCSVGVPFHNVGTVAVERGGLRFVRPFIQSAGWTRVGDGGIVSEQGITLLGGVLAGTNVVRGNVTNSAVVSPGTSYGRLTIEGTYVQTTNGRLQIEVSGPLAGVQHDQLVVTNLARLGGTLEVTVLGGYALGPGTVLTALVCNARSGTFHATAKPPEYYVLYMPKTVLLETENAPPVPQLWVEAVQKACHPFTLRGAAADPDGSITNLSLLVNDVVVGQFPNQASGWVLACCDFPGEVLCAVQATDNKGAMGEANALVTFTAPPLHVLDPVGFQTNRAFKLCLCGESGSNYVIEASADLWPTTWTTLGTMENTNGIWRFFDSTATNATRRFYRARQL